MQEFEKQQEEIKRLETFVEKNITRASTSGMAKSRRKTLEKMERIDKPMIDARSANIQFGFDRNTGNDVMHIHDLKIGYDSPITLPINLEIFKGDHIAIIGPNGVGKTTTIAKLAHYYAEQGKKVIIAAGDTFRAAASEQLSIWADRVGVSIVKHKEGADPAAVVFDACASAVAKEADLVIVDTAGRLHTKVNLMDQTLLVLDGTTGQNAVSQAKLFGEAVPVTGIVVTKLDGTAKGGVVISIKEELGVPVRWIGVGEQMDDLRPFNAKEFANALFDKGE